MGRLPKVNVVIKNLNLLVCLKVFEKDALVHLCRAVIVGVVAHVHLISSYENLLKQTVGGRW